MDRFFSKLDLRDIKIKPEGSRFLPDDEDVEVNDGSVVTSIDLTEEVDAADYPELTNHHDSEEHTHVISATYERIEVESWQATVEMVEVEQPCPTLRQQNDAEVLKVSAKSRPSAVAGAIAGVVRENGRAEVQAIGAGATNQAIKAIAIAREYLLDTDIDAICIPAFIDVMIDNEERTAIRLVIETR